LSADFKSVVAGAAFALAATFFFGVAFFFGAVFFGVNLCPQSHTALRECTGCPHSGHCFIGGVRFFFPIFPTSNLNRMCHQQPIKRYVQFVSGSTALNTRKKIKTGKKNNVGTGRDSGRKRGVFGWINIHCAKCAKKKIKQHQRNTSTIQKVGTITPPSGIVPSGQRFAVATTTGCQQS